MSFFKKLASLSATFKSSLDFNVAATAFKNAPTGVSSIDNVFKNLPIAMNTRNKAVVNGIEIKSVRKFLDAGDLSGMLKALNVTTVLDPQVNVAFKNFASVKSPVPTLNKININKTSARKLYPDLDVSTKNMVDYEAFLKGLSDVQKKKIGGFENTLKKMGKVVLWGVGGASIALLSRPFLQSVFEAMKASTGAFFSYMENGKVKTCKLISRSCGTPETSTNGTTTQACSDVVVLPQELSYNLYFFVQFIKKNSNLIQTALLNKYQIPISRWTPTITEIFKDKMFVDQLESIYREDYNHAFNVKYPCDVAEIKLGCLASNTNNMEVTAYDHYDQSYDPNLPDGSYLFCVSDPSIIDVITDLIISNGGDLLDNILSSKWFTYAKWVGFISIALVVIYFIFKSLILPMLAKNKYKNQMFPQMQPMYPQMQGMPGMYMNPYTQPGYYPQ